MGSHFLTILTPWYPHYFSLSITWSFLLLSWRRMKQAWIVKMKMFVHILGKPLTGPAAAPAVRVRSGRGTVTVTPTVPGTWCVATTTARTIISGLTLRRIVVLILELLKQQQHLKWTSLNS